jgi:cysteine protease ATG4
MSQFAHGISSFDSFNVTNFDEEKLVWLLGKSFNKDQMEDYRQAFESILWFTYRRDFDQMKPYEYTSDAGWGCMLRSAQMMVSQAFQRRLLGSTWRRVSFTPMEQLPQEYIQILKWFVDSPHPDCVYSIHNMVKIGMQYDKLPGEWYGPTTAAQVLR